jgi:hypothetical protein
MEAVRSPKRRSVCARLRGATSQKTAIYWCLPPVACDRWAVAFPELRKEMLILSSRRPNASCGWLGHCAGCLLDLAHGSLWHKWGPRWIAVCRWTLAGLTTWVPMWVNAPRVWNSPRAHVLDIGTVNTSVKLPVLNGRRSLTETNLATVLLAYRPNSVLAECPGSYLRRLERIKSNL